jgi:hypothetical protein
VTAVEELPEGDRRWSGSSLASCFVCQTPLPREEAVGLGGEVAHRRCALAVLGADDAGA